MTEVRAGLDEAVALCNAGRFAEAEAVCRRVVEVEPRNFAAVHQLAIAVGRQNRFEECLRWLNRVIELAPNSVNAWRDIGIVHCNTRNFVAAKAAYQRTVQLDPRHAPSITQLARICTSLGQLDEAVRVCDQALAVDPGEHAAKGQRAISLLLKGDLARGFADYEVRHSVANFSDKKRDIAVRQWDGRAAIAGKTIVLYGEQGLGDTLQFLRYVPIVRGRGGKRKRGEGGACIIVEVQAESLRRIAARVTGVLEGDVIVRGEGWPVADFCCPLMSLPHRLGTTLASVPSRVPYIRLDDSMRQKWADLIAPHPLKIGLVWAGSTKHTENAWRSIMPEQLAPLAAVPNVAWYNLQRPLNSSPPPPLPFPLINLLDRCDDFYDTAGLVDQLDLVIGVDTAVVHLAGALGKPVWVLLPQRPDWRWMFQREDSPWYPTMRLVRQRVEGNWVEVLQRVAGLLKALPKVMR
ncbi:MAG: tetratricopeptide repeat protein [Phycisphaerales bacterium]|nr:tetratricopeptide repeat protein [Phycisphaerales bacterium]